MERAAKKTYPELVRAEVLDPLGMDTTEPDFNSREIPHRTRGYELEGNRLLEVLDDDIS